jgi:two-component system response regulator RpaA
MKALTTGDVSKICSVASRTVGKWMDKNLLAGYRLPGSQDRRIPVDSLLAFLIKHDMPVEPLKQHLIQNNIPLPTDLCIPTDTTNQPLN